MTLSQVVITSLAIQIANTYATRCGYVEMGNLQLSNYLDIPSPVLMASNVCMESHHGKNISSSKFICGKEGNSLLQFTYNGTNNCNDKKATSITQHPINSSNFACFEQICPYAKIKISSNPITTHNSNSNQKLAYQELPIVINECFKLPDNNYTNITCTQHQGIQFNQYYRTQC